MSKITLVGDIHGEAYYDGFCRIVEESGHPVVQIGDFGLGFKGCGDFDNSAREFLQAHSNARFMRGNHDNPAVCRSMPGFVEDGEIMGNAMFIGGAYSIDHMHRKAGRDWWPDEQVSDDDFEKIAEVHSERKPSIMVTHDCPDCILRRMFGYDTVIETNTGKMLSRMLNRHQPDLWVFGHHHKSLVFEDDLSGVKFVCLDECETLEIDIGE